MVVDFLFSSTGLAFLAIFAMVAVVIGAVFFLISRAEKNRDRALKEFAEKHGLVFKPGSHLSPAKVLGELNGRSVTCNFITKGRGRVHGVYFYFLMKAKGKKGSFSLVVSRESILDGALKSSGAVKDIEVGRPGFDKKYFVRSNNEIKAKDFLSVDVQNRIAEELADPTNRLVIERGVAVVEMEVAYFNDERLEKTAGLLSFVCEKMEG